jgi:prostaglandin reductase 3
MGLPKSFKKAVVQKLSNSFREATTIVSVDMDTLLSSLKPDQVIVQNIYVGINASDINFSAGNFMSNPIGRYDQRLKPPFDIGFESIGTVVHKGSKTSIPIGAPVAIMFFQINFRGSGCFAEFQAVNEAMLIPIPALDRKFLGLVVSGLTASLALGIGYLIQNITVT